jgi:hypothetical protein
MNLDLVEQKRLGFEKRKREREKEGKEEEEEMFGREISRRVVAFLFLLVWVCDCLCFLLWRL